MAHGNHQGRARTSARSPRAKGECQCCGFWWPLLSLRRQMEWAGTSLRDTGFLVCPRCLDVPQPQLRTLILPPDPIPVPNPRPSLDGR